MNLPLQAVGVVALWSAASGAGLVPFRLPGSGWQVPQKWGKVGDKAYGWLFGVILGFGWLTRLPSVGFYALVAWGLASPSWLNVWVVCLSFAVGRALPFLAIMFWAERAREYPALLVEGSSALVALAVRPFEIGVLTAFGLVLLS